MVDMASPFNSLIQGNQQPAQNPLTQIGQLAQTQTALTNSQRASVQLNDEQLANAQNDFASRISALTPYIAKGDSVTGNDVMGGLSDLVAASKGAFSADEAAHFYSGFRRRRTDI